jgi:phosphoribosylanthranilate isomerase
VAGNATWVKICGVTRLEDARAAFDSGADAIGINFWPGSKRYCEPARAREIVAKLAAGELVYGVFVDETRERIAELVREVGLGGVQLHGSEAAEEAEGWGVPVIRAVAATTSERIAEVLRNRGQAPISAQASADRATSLPQNRSQSPRILIDNAAGGGSGKIVDAALLEGVDLGEAIVAGGLTPANVAATVARLRPFGVDTAGGVESAPGIKDARLIDAFARAARAGEARSA